MEDDKSRERTLLLAIRMAAMSISETAECLCKESGVCAICHLDRSLANYSKWKREQNLKVNPFKTECGAV